MAQKFVNNLTVKLIGDITTAQTTITVDTTSRFPLLQLGDWFYLTITDKREGGELRWEVVKVNSWTGTTLTCVRAQDGTTAQSWLSGSELSLRITAADMFDYEQLKDSKGQINGIAPLDPAGKIATNYLYDVVNSSTQTALDTKLPSSSYTAADVLAKIKTVDGSGSGLDADTLDGMQPATGNTASTIVQRDASGNFSAGTITAALSGNASTATKLTTARTISLSGDATGSISFDGSSNVTIPVVIADDSHNHVISNVDGLQAALDGKSATSHNHTLDSLSNTTITSNTAGEILKWDGTAWVNNTLAEAGIQPAGSYLTTTGKAADADKLDGLDSTDFLRSTATAAAATKLATARTINGVAFDGTGNITINAVDSTARIAATEKGAANGVATLGGDGKVPSTQLPSYVDDVLEFTNLAGFPATGESGKIYVALDTNKTYRWSGTAYVYITSGAVDSVAGKTGVVTLAKADVGLGNVDNTSDANKPVSTATQTALNAKQNTITGAATTITSSNLTASMAMVTDASGKVAAHGTVSATELGYLDGVTSAIQTQLNNKAATTHTHAISDVTGLQTALDGKLGATANAASATKLATARTISLTGDTTGSVSFDGSADASISVTVVDDSHNHVIDNVDGLQTALDAKLPSSSYTAADVLAKVKTVDGASSGLDADLLDGLESTVFTRSGSSVALTGDVTGTATVSASGAISIATTIAANSVTLGTDTTGNYVADLTQGTGIVVSGTAGEGWSPTVALSNIGTAGTYKSVTTDAQGRVTAGTNPTTLAGYGITDAQTAARASATFTTTANGWYRIATSTIDIGRNSGEFVVDWSVGGNHGSVRFAAGCHYGQTNGTSIMQTNYAFYGSNGITEARIVYHTTFTANYAYVEVKFGSALTSVAVNVELQDALGWSLITPSTAGSIPSGYTSYTHTFISAGQITAGTYPKVTINQEGRVTSGTALVAADIPSLDTSKLTTGTLPVARGGTGVATITGLIKGNGTNAMTAAVAGTDYVVPSGSITGNAATATKLATARTINGVSFDGTANITISDATKAPLASPALTGTPTAPTAAVGTNTTQIATTAFVQAEIANDAPTKTGTGASGNWGINITGNAATVTNGVYTTGDQTIGGVKTFSSSPIVPTATTATQAINSNSVFGFKNYIINGNFDIWQYGMSQTTSGYGSDDRWNNLNAGSTKTHSQVACTDTERVLFNASKFSRTVVSSVVGANNQATKIQNIEDVTKLAGKTVTLSFWAKADSNKNIAIEFWQGFGTGGSPSSGVAGIGSQLVALTTTWQKKTITVTLPSIVGKTLGTDGVHTTFTGIIFWFDAGSDLNSRTANLGQRSGTFDIAQVQLEEGSVATPFEQRPYGLELSLCQRYYWKISILALNFSAYVAGAINSWILKLPVTMRSVPTITHNLNQPGSYVGLSSWDIGFTYSDVATPDIVRVLTRSTAQDTNVNAEFNTSVAFISGSAEL